MTPSLRPSRRSVSASAASNGPMPPKLGDQRLGQRLGVAARDGEGEQIFDQLMVEQRLGAAVEQALAQAGAVPWASSGSVGHRRATARQQRRACNGAFVPRAERSAARAVKGPHGCRAGRDDGGSAGATRRAEAVVWRASSGRCSAFSCWSSSRSPACGSRGGRSPTISSQRVRRSAGCRRPTRSTASDSAPSRSAISSSAIPANPDLTARVALIQMRLKWNGSVEVYRIAARGVRLQGQRRRRQGQLGPDRQIASPAKRQAVHAAQHRRRCRRHDDRAAQPRSGRSASRCRGAATWPAGSRASSRPSARGSTPGACRLEELRAYVVAGRGGAAAARRSGRSAANASPARPAGSRWTSRGSTSTQLQRELRQLRRQGAAVDDVARRGRQRARRGQQQSHLQGHARPRSAARSTSPRGRRGWRRSSPTAPASTAATGSTRGAARSRWSADYRASSVALAPSLTGGGHRSAGVGQGTPLGPIGAAMASAISGAARQFRRRRLAAHGQSPRRRRGADRKRRVRVAQRRGDQRLRRRRGNLLLAEREAAGRRQYRHAGRRPADGANPLRQPRSGGADERRCADRALCRGRSAARTGPGPIRRRAPTDGPKCRPSPCSTGRSAAGG